MVENIFRRLAQNPESRRSMSAQIFDAGREVLRPIVFAIGIIIIVYLPILTFENVEGKMFRPMAYTVIFALAGSLLCALTWCLCSRLCSLKGFPQGSVAGAHVRSRACRDHAMGRPNPKLAVGTAAALLVGSFVLAPFLGSAFIPTLDEGTLNLDVMRIPSISLDDAVANATRTEKVLKEVPKSPASSRASDIRNLQPTPTDPTRADVYVFLKPQHEWRSDRERWSQTVFGCLDRHSCCGLRKA